MLIKRLLKFKDVTDTSGVNKRTMFLSKNFRSVGIETNHPITLVERKCLVFFFLSFYSGGHSTSTSTEYKMTDRLRTKTKNYSRNLNCDLLIDPKIIKLCGAFGTSLNY